MHMSCQQKYKHTRSYQPTTHHPVQNDEFRPQLEDDVVEPEGAYVEYARVETVGDPPVRECHGEHTQTERQQSQQEGEEVELVPDGADPVR